MNASLADELARRVGMAPGYVDTWGEYHAVAGTTQRALLGAMGYPCDDADAIRAALARLEVRNRPAAAATGPAFLPAALAGDGRRWGIAVQLYGVRSPRNWGIGDFTDLAELMRGAAALGAAAVGINPLHALFPERPDHASPYSPSSRRFINPLYLDVEAIDDLARCAAAREHVASSGFQSRLAAARTASLVDYAAVAALKWPILSMLYREFRTSCVAADGDPRARAFRRFQAERGSDLRRFATFHALAATQRDMDWRNWPNGLADPDSAAIAEFAATHVEPIEYREYLQWQAALQLDRVNAIAHECAMGIGLYVDLAVGADPTGAEAWSTQRISPNGVSIGAPPDALNLLGQDWGSPPPDPFALADAGYKTFTTLLDANMRHAGALRIDHILGLARLWWIPAGAPASEGAYVNYPSRDLFNALADASRQRRCLAIGEDLGTVPAGLRETMRDAGVLSYRLMYFEQRDGRFPAPQEFPAAALVAVGTHDLPPLPMWWRGDDIDLRDRLRLWPNDAMRDVEARQREHARGALMSVLRAQSLCTQDGIPDDAPVEAIHAWLARTPCKLLMVQFEDVLDGHGQINVPGTTDEYPNWRQRMARPLDAALADPRMQRIAAILNDSGRGD
ncbi:MAG: 4-alpha-glucanotransferase [Rhodanobacteraceae bacterium]